ncbi:MAG: hypothetical protein ACOY3Z_00095 [Thermodesulfobacteriota bacterium]
MQCKHLCCYSHGSNRWAVASCAAKATPYVPSVFELEHFCRGVKHAICPTYLIGLGGESLRPGALSPAISCGR